MHTKRAEKAILKQDALGRVTHTREQREALLNEFERSGMKGLPFARMVGVNYQTFASWIQKRRRSRGDYARMTSKRPSTAQSGQKPHGNGVRRHEARKIKGSSVIPWGKVSLL